MKHRKKKKPWAVLIAILLAIVIGTLSGKERGLFGVSFYSMYDLIGKLFINSLTLIIVPLVSSSIITGIARIGSEGEFGRIGIKTFIFYFVTKIIAIIIGVAVINLFHPGTANVGNITELISTEKLASLGQHLNQDGKGAFVAMILDLIPPNVLDAFAKGNMLGLIFFSFIFGYALTHISTKAAESHMNFWNGIFEAMINITHYIMKVLPLGVFCLVAKVFAETGLKSLASVGMFFVTVLLALAIFVFVALPLLLKFVSKVNPWNQFRAMAPALITAFSTSSSSAALPITMECMEKRAGVSNRICSLVIPLGVSVNLTGSALYEGMAALYVAQSFGVDLSIGTQFLFIFMTLLTSIGIASIPSGSLVIILVLLRVLGLPAEGVGLFLAVDRILDMFRSTTNIFADGCCAVFVARSEGEKDILTKKEFEPI
ncbi:MAG: dicarboxylate/amino acid:cation symporter [Verrucomicrobia bacterium]|nr:dicarboxylate/amino acid:cation symporter [Verrucomicrobiota bacterium]